jgi:hypothetical protein
MVFFPFSGWKERFLGTLHGQGKHAAQRKAVIVVVANTAFP